MFKVGIIGCGRIGQLLEEDRLREKPATHAGAYLACRQTKITSACDTNSERLTKFGEKFGIDKSHLYNNYRQMLKNEKLDIISVATSTKSHCPMVIEAAKAKHTKGIYCEKPIALNIRDANRMIAVCKKEKVALIIGHERRFDANFIKVKKIIDKKTFGKLKTIIGQTLSGPPLKLSVSKHAGGSLFHDGTHLLDLALYFGGQALWVAGFDERKFGRRNIESTAIGIIKFRDGANMLFEAGGEREYFKFDLDLQFERGRILIGNSGIEMFRSNKSRHYLGFRELESIPYSAPASRQNSFLGIVKELVSAVKNRRKPASSGEEARDSLELILAIYRSASLGGSKVTLPKRKAL